MFRLLDESIDSLNRPSNIEYHRVFDTVKESGRPNFLHGVAVDSWKKRIAVCFAFNSKDENSITEELLIRWSDDRGKSWTEAEHIAPPSGHANSHSVFISTNDALWCFGPRFNGLGEPPLSSKGFRSIHFLNLQMEAWRYDGCSWKAMGIVGDDFWPLGAPTRLENGNWLIAGCDTYWFAAAAISNGDDLTHWEVFKPDTHGEIFTEAAAWVNGNRVLMVMRNQSALTDGKYNAAVALSTDGGRTFGECELSNLPMATTKPFCGTLSDGRIYMVFNESIPEHPYNRDRMLLGIGSRGGFTLSKLYVVDEGCFDNQSKRRCSLSYPYAKEIDGKLYITYSYESMPTTGRNHNDAMLAVIDIKEL